MITSQDCPRTEHESAALRLLRPVQIRFAVLLSIGLLIPCFWQEHISAGDLSSHVYNAWLVTQVRAGAAPGVTLVHPWTNVLSDWLLERLLPGLGPAWTERIVAGGAVLVFFWGAFFFIRAVTGRWTWLFAPLIAMLAYGLAFNLGFLNFYLSTGLALWIMGLLWHPDRERILITLPLWILAILAHPMPVVWAAFVIGYAWLLRRLPAGKQPAALLLALLVMILAQMAVLRLVPHRWSLLQSFNILGALGLTGADQVLLSDAKYLIVVAGSLAVWLALFLKRVERRGMGRDPMVHLWVLQMAAFVLAPAALQLPQYQHVFSYIPQRLSLFNAVVFCAMAGGGRYSRSLTGLAFVVAAIYFTFLYRDDSAFNHIERQVQSLIETVPQGGRVVAEIDDANSRLSPLLHVGDRPCIGHCWSYGNYEAATAQFRLRVTGENPVVASTMDVVKEIEQGRHIVTAAEAPIYSICNCNGALCMKRIPAGEKTCSVSVPVTPPLSLP